MSVLARLRSFLAALVFRRRLEHDMLQEWQFHLDARTEDLVARGIPRAEAEARARREFGDQVRWKLWGREARGLQLIDDLRQDAAYAIRQLSSAPLFTAAAVLTLALGIGANTAIFSVVNAVLLRPLPYKGSDRLVRFIDNYFPLGSGPGRATPPLRVPGMDLGDFGTLRTHTRTLSHVAMFSQISMAWTGRDGAVRLQASQVSPAVFPMLGVPAWLGRTFDPAEDDPGAVAVAVLSYTTWQRHFSGNRNIVGQVLTIDGTGRLVIGVMPAGFEFPDAQTELWVPFVPPALPPGARMGRPAIARVKDEVTLQAAAGEVNAILPPPPAADRQGRGGTTASTRPRFELVRMQDWLVEPVKPALVILAAAVGCVLLIACVNVANLLLARTAAREREIAIRLALGAGRGRVIRQLLTESVLLAILGAVAGTGLAFGGVRLLRTLGAALPRRDSANVVSLPRLDEIGIDASVLLFTLAVAVLTGLIFGLAPAVRHSRPRSMNVLHDGSGSPMSGFEMFRRPRMQSLLIVAEIAMAMMLFVGGGLLMRSFVRLSTVDPGYDLPDVVTFQVVVPQRRYSPVQYVTVAEDISARLQSSAVLRSAGYATFLPMVPGRAPTSLRTTPGSPEQSPPPLRPPSPDRPLLTAVSRDFLSAAGIHLMAGRGFTETDGAGQPRVMLINQTIARSGLLGEHPLGTHMYIGGGSDPIEIVGIVEDIRQFGLDKDPIAQVFVDFRQFPPSPIALSLGRFPLWYAVRTDDRRSAVIASIRAMVRQVEPEATVDDIATLQQLVSDSISRPRLYAVLLGIFAAVAVTLAAVGLYGVMAYSVTRRTREIGIRMALGAARADVLRLVLGQTLVLTGVGITLGLFGAGVFTRYLAGLLFGLTPLDPTTFIAVALVFGAVATSAALVPARRATNVDPLIALRYE
jgi:putative ABC transport system permease protein